VADRYLLESGAPDGYLLEDASGVLLLEAAATPVSDAGRNETSNLVQTPHIQGGYSTVQNLLLTTLAVFAAGSQLVKREATVHNPKPAPAVQVFQVPNLLTSTLGVQVVPIPPGEQRCDSAPASAWIGDIDPVRNGVLLDVAQVVPIPPGKQETDSAPPAQNILYWDRGANILFLPAQPLPTGEQRTDSAASTVFVPDIDPVRNKPLLDAVVANPLPQGQQETANLVQTPDVWVFTPPQIIPPAVTVNPLPIGKQETDSAPATPRIGDIKFARGLDPGPPAAAAPLPPGESSFLPVPYRNERPQIDQPANLLGSAIGLQPIASANIEWTQKLGPPDVFLWLPENVTINLPVVANPIPVGQQRTDSSPIVNPAVYVFTPPQIIPPIVQQIPIGKQETDSSPYAVQRLNVDQPPNLLVLPQPIPVGRNQVDSAPIWNPPVQSFTAPVILPPIVVPIPPGQQRTESAPIPAPDVWAFNAPIIIPPIAQPLPIGQPHSDSAPIWAVPIGMSVGWTIPPDLLPPGVDHFPIPVVTETPAGGVAKRPYRKRFVVEVDGELFEVRSEQEAVKVLEQLVVLAKEQANLAIDRAQKAQKRPKRKVLADARKTLVIPKVEANRWLSDMADQAMLKIEEIYEDALRIIEIGALLKKRDDDDEDEIATILLML
jgi:hypothetical protein